MDAGFGMLRTETPIFADLKFFSFDSKRRNAAVQEQF